MSTRRCFVILLLAAALSLCALIYLATPGFVSTIDLTIYALTANESLKTIVYWNKFFGYGDFLLGEGFHARHCPVYTNCFATSSRFLKAHNYDALVIHGINDELNPNDLPDKRRPEQRYVFFSLESPANRHIGPEFDGYFNDTMTYRLDSEVVRPYADIVDRSSGVRVAPSRTPVEWKSAAGAVETKEEEEEEARRLADIVRGKRKLAVWYRSNCYSRGRREQYVEELERQGVDVAKYGKCSEEPGCPVNQDCFKIDVEPNYFFYLAFENSLCDDYVTEKLFNALKVNVVPVVYGGADYSRFAPAHSYIDALDFDTPADLARYLVDLSHNASEYMKYFEWKRYYRVADPRERLICDLCALVNGQARKTYDISSWYSLNSCAVQRRLDEQIARGGLNYATRLTRQ